METHAPYLLRKLYGEDSTTNSRAKIEKILQRFGSDSGLFEKIIIKPLGKLETSPFELYVLLKNQMQKITNVGYGVSQILPIIIEVIARDNMLGLQYNNQKSICILKLKQHLEILFLNLHF